MYFLDTENGKHITLDADNDIQAENEATDYLFDNSIYNQAFYVYAGENGKRDRTIACVALECECGDTDCWKCNM